MPAAAAETLTGTALIRERIALPQGATFEAVIADISRADAPARPLARTVIDDPGQPPIAFAIGYDPAALDSRSFYALRATLRHQGRLLFTADTVTRVLQQDGPHGVELVLKRAGPDSSGPAGPLPAHGLRLPATFRGTLPFADFEGVRHHLDLWPDQYYQMRREWLGGETSPSRRDEIGRWYADPARDAIVLHGASEMPLVWEVKGPDRLRQTDLAGNPIESDRDHALTSDGTLEPTELEDLFMLGRMTYKADTATFEECVSGVHYPIAQDGGYGALERAYLEAAPRPGAPVTVHVEGDLALRPATEGAARASLVVDRFIAVRGDDACTRPEPQAALTDTYWRIDSLIGDDVRAQANRREPHLVLHGGAERRFRATVGCNRIVSRYEVADDALTFEPGALTRMACPPPLDALERTLLAALSLTRTARQEGQTLDLLDAEGMPLAHLPAVYLR
ncbi:YbaY family lipoprotein [Rhodovulum sp. 12E13]|uniref:YbaY family lipoprotein n=1 Tax=Rhodovulum sp. 12E13 TaxID=2203891 RepID=UPI0018F400F5|nr:YbaY family lipoprotein [Rhodovulum sp. 12E13]